MGVEADSAERARAIFEASSNLQPSERRVGRHEAIRRVAQENPDMLGPDSPEVGVVMQKNSLLTNLLKREPKPRAEEEVSGSEVVRQSSKQPVVLRPPLEASRKELAQHRADTHTRVAHKTSNLLAHVTGIVDGVVDATANGVAEIAEDLSFGISKTKHSVIHGWQRGRDQSQDRE